ncbi:MAG: hypothetical protein QW051_01200 [Candidatus Aenigmatarchaeota archaeon]
MNTNELILNYINSEKKPREVGRYWATDIYPILKGYLTPKNFFTYKEIDLKGASNILSGEAYETKWKEILEFNRVKFKYGEEAKKEIVIGDKIILVVKPDFEFENWVLETKCPAKETKFISEIPEKWIYQLECEHRATNKPVYLGIFSHPFSLTYYSYKPSLARWNLIQKTLIEFDTKLRSLAKNF